MEKAVGTLIANWLFRGTLLILMGCWFSASVGSATAQTVNNAPEGDNAVWLNSSSISGSSAFIDASAWCGGSCDGADLCFVVNKALDGRVAQPFLTNHYNEGAPLFAFFAKGGMRESRLNPLLHSLTPHC
jgi:hypothetical protein